MLRYQATLDQFPVFGREGYVLPLGPAVQHTGEIDSGRPVEQVWIFSKPAVAFESPQCVVEIGEDGAPELKVAEGVRTRFFGEPLPVGRL